MMKKAVRHLPIFVACLLWATSCSQDSANPAPTPGSGTPTNTSWTIPQDQVFDGGPGKDGIPSVDNP
ncbi:MAG: hypothetical protein AAGC85_28365, partial [Bacteroidota bacterium]